MRKQDQDGEMICSNLYMHLHRCWLWNFEYQTETSVFAIDGPGFKSYLLSVQS
jgi:hypothetical protein